MLRRIGYRCCPILNNLENKYCDAAAGGQRKSSHVIAKMSETYTLRDGVKLRRKEKGISIARGSARRTLIIRMICSS